MFFGVLCEWFYFGWIYNFKLEIFNEGLCWVGFLGLLSDDFVVKFGESFDDVCVWIVDWVGKVFNGFDVFLI